MWFRFRCWLAWMAWRCGLAWQGCFNREDRRFCWRLAWHPPKRGQPLGWEEDMRPCVCEDCGAPYETMGLDIVLPDDQWEMICPGRDGGGILCGSCIAKRAAILPCATVIHAYIDLVPVGPGPQARIFTTTPDGLGRKGSSPLKVAMGTLLFELRRGGH